MLNRASQNTITRMLQKADVTATNSLSGVVDLGVPANAFLTSLGDVGAFDAVRTGGAIFMPLESARGLRASSAMIDGDNDGSPALARPIGQLQLDPATMVVRWPSAIVILTDEVLRLAPPGTLAFLARELTRAAIASTDIRFLAAMAEDAPTVEATSNFLSDLSAAIDELEIEFLPPDCC